MLCYSIPLVSMCNIPSIYTKMKYLPGEKKNLSNQHQIKWLLCWTLERNERAWWMPWGQNNDSLAACSWKKKSKMENLSYFNLNSREDCGKSGRVASFITSTFDQRFLNAFVPSGIRESGLFCVTGYKLLINGAGSEDAGWVVPPTHESSGGCWMQTQLSCASKDDCIVRDFPILKIINNLHIIISVGLEWAVKRKDDSVWSLVMSKKSLAQGRGDSTSSCIKFMIFWVSDSFFQRSFLVIFYSGID